MNSPVTAPALSPDSKLSRHAFVRFWQAHAWAGVVTSLLVYVMFFLGAVVLFYRPLTIWEEPLLQRPTAVLPSLQRAVEIAAPEVEEFYLYLPNDVRPMAKLGYFLPDTTTWRMWWIDTDAGKSIPEREKAAAFVYDLHYLWHDVTGYWLQYGAGVLVFGFLLALVTGVLIHYGRFARQLYRWRPERERRVVWSDLHKVAGVFGLPFQLVYAITGSMMVLSPLMFELSIRPVFGGDVARAVATAAALVEDPPERDFGAAQPALPLDQLVARAQAAEPRLEVESVVYRGYGHAQGTIDVRGPIAGQPFGDGMVRLKAATAQVELVETPDHESAVGTLARWIHGLHTVEYGGIASRWLLFVLALGGCLTLLTGNWIWIERRAAANPTIGTTLLAKLTAGVGVGCFAAVAALLLSSRLLPLDWSNRIQLEELAMAAMLGFWILFGCFTKSSTALWWRGLGVAGVLLCCVPIAATHHSARGLFGAGPGLSLVVITDAVFLCAGLLLLATAYLLRRTRLARMQLPRGGPTPAQQRSTLSPDAGAQLEPQLPTAAHALGARSTS